MKHGADAASKVIPGENAEDYKAMNDAYFETTHPVGPLEVRLVGILVDSDWKMERFDRIVNAAITRLIDPTLPPDEAMAVLLTDKKSPLHRILSLHRSAERAWFQANRELQKLQKARLVAPTVLPSASDNQNGFVPEKTPAVSNPAAEVPSAALQV